MESMKTLIIFFLCMHLVMAVPTINGASGTMTQGQTATITGTGFGSWSRSDILAWDDMDSYIVGSEIPNTPRIGTWNKFSTSSNDWTITAKIDNKYSISGSNSMWGQQGLRDWSGASVSFSDVKDLYVSFWFRFNHQGVGQHKVMQVKGNMLGSCEDYHPIISTGDSAEWWKTGIGLDEPRGQYSCQATDPYNSAYTTNPVQDTWYYLEAIMTQGDPDVWNGYAEIRINGEQEFLAKNVITRVLPGSEWELVQMMNGMTNFDSSNTWVDDMYVADSFARILLCDKTTYSQSTKCFMQIPSVWNTQSATFAVNKGTLTAGQTAYLFVFDSTGSMNANGYPVTVGAGGSSAACGNSIIDSGEQCDDGNAITESCAYGQTSCTVCSASCLNIAGATSYCGDGTCKSPETQVSCSSDCSSAVVCGNGKCDSGESCTSCSIDCGQCTSCSDTTICQSALFCSGFEEGNKDVWDDYDGNPDTENQIISDAGPCNTANNHVMRFRVPAGRGGADLVKEITPNDKLYARWYQKWESGYDFSAANHGSGLNAGSRDYLGQSDYRPNGNDFFGTWLEPNAGDPALNGKPNLYSYYRGMYQDCADPNGACWGDHFPCMYSDNYCEKQEHKGTTPAFQAGKWYCIEIMLDSGSAVQSDSLANGMQDFWIDGVEYGPFQHLWHRTSANVKPDILWLSLFHHGEHSVEGTMYDNVVVSTQKIGCLGTGPAAQKCTDADTDSNNSLSLTELNAYVAKWKTGQVGLASLMEVIGKWKNGC